MRTAILACLQETRTLTAASMFAGDSSFGLDSMEMMLTRMVSTCTIMRKNIPAVNNAAMDRGNDSITGQSTRHDQLL